MGRREKAIVRAILKAILSSPREYSRLHKIWILFAILNVPLQRFGAEDFRKLRADTWNMKEEEYWQSFDARDERGKKSLHGLSDLGFSGSTFFETSDHKYLIKSLSRDSESDFFKNEFRGRYCQYMADHPESLLVRMTDFLHAPAITIGGLLKLVPQNHIVMENTLHGKDDDFRGDRWETYDLKPANYFYPERDVLDGNLASAEAQDKVVDLFKDKIRITPAQHESFAKTIQADTDFLQKANTVDYSLFLVRYPTDGSSTAGGTWRTGIMSVDGKWIYRAIILDFLWSKHKLPAKAMTALIETYNTIDNQGPMSLTTSAVEFRERFCSMVESFIESSNV